MIYCIDYICCRTLTLLNNFDMSKNTAEERKKFFKKLESLYYVTWLCVK